MRLSQQPIVFTPAVLHMDLASKAPLSCRARRTLSEQTVREYSKTAAAISEAPWHLNKASAFLNELIEANEQEADPALAPTIDFVQNGSRMYEPLLPHEFAELRDFAPKTPKPISVEIVTKRRKVVGKKSLAALVALAGLPAPPAAPRVRQRPAPLAGGSQRSLGCSKCR